MGSDDRLKEIHFAPIQTDEESPMPTNALDDESEHSIDPMLKAMAGDHFFETEVILPEHGIGKNYCFGIIKLTQSEFLRFIKLT